MEAKEILEQATTAVTKNRQDLYGPAERNFETISFLWSQYLQMQVLPHEVALCLALVKFARTITSPEHMDNYIDLAGYAALAGELADHLDAGITEQGLHVRGREEVDPAIPHGA